MYKLYNNKYYWFIRKGYPATTKGHPFVKFMDMLARIFKK